jgi:hypothetical protein
MGLGIYYELPEGIVLPGYPGTGKDQQQEGKDRRRGPDGMDIIWSGFHQLLLFQFNHFISFILREIGCHDPVSGSQPFQDFHIVHVALPEADFLAVQAVIPGHKDILDGSAFIEGAVGYQQDGILL